LAEQVGDQACLHFYSTLFLTHPETRDLFPLGMAGQRDKLLGALGRIVSSVDALDELMAFLQQLGLVQALRVGDVLRLGSAVGQRLTLPPDGGEDLLLIAGGTGLAPFKALIEQVASEGGRRKVHLIMGARTERDLYDLKAMTQLGREQRWLTILPAISADPFASRVERGTAVDIALRYGAWREHEIYVCGSQEMVAGTVEGLAQSGIEPERIRFEPFQAKSAPAYSGGTS